ncbi:eae-like domain protein [Escherichia sp. E10V4]|uniref:eae-like domain protein n=1 Tax=Escherichia sp. E10V4 TaxID=2478971 RepID=UPI001037D889|nr:eae-like domain protein [Escherichia sp. E10V4]TBR64126.1 eae-like domain protein [Escherichia sp. E10V4]
MEGNIKGLVAAGHEMASELKAECGAVDMRSVAKLIIDLATQLEVQLVRANALAAENAGLKAFKTAVYQQMGVGCDAPEFSITAGLSNLRRFADTLHAIECEFFTKELPDEEHEGETFNECPLSWGMSVEQYVSEFRKCLAEVRAGAFNDLCAAFVRHAKIAGLDDGDTVTLKEATDALMHCAEQLREGVKQ